MSKAGSRGKKGKISWLFHACQSCELGPQQREKSFCTPIQQIWWSCGLPTFISHLVSDSHHTLSTLTAKQACDCSTAVTLSPPFVRTDVRLCSCEVTLQSLCLMNQSWKGEVVCSMSRKERRLLSQFLSRLKTVFALLCQKTFFKMFSCPVYQHGKTSQDLSSHIKSLKCLNFFRCGSTSLWWGASSSSTVLVLSTLQKTVNLILSWKEW